VIRSVLGGLDVHLFEMAGDTDALERHFWRTLLQRPAIYGADSLGSLFQRSGCSWSFNNIDNVCLWQSSQQEYEEESDAES
jgi:hypothetical protein